MNEPFIYFSLIKSNSEVNYPLSWQTFPFPSVLPDFPLGTQLRCPCSTIPLCSGSYPCLCPLIFLLPPFLLPTFPSRSPPVPPAARGASDIPPQHPGTSQGWRGLKDEEVFVGNCSQPVLTDHEAWGKIC